MNKTGERKYGLAKGVEQLHVLQCRACRVHIGYISHKRIAFCDDPACVTIREWVWSNEDVVARINCLRDEFGMSLAEIARELDLPYNTVNDMYANFGRRKLYAPVANPEAA